MKSGIYIIENLVTKKVYVGRSNNVAQRLSNHRVDLRNNRSCNAHMQASFNLHGEEVFRFFKVCSCTKENLAEKEEYWIKLLDATNPEKGFNFYICDREIDIRRKKELKERQRAVRRELKKGKQILVLDSETGDVEFNLTISEIEEILGLTRKYVYRITSHYPNPNPNGRTHRSYKGHIFVYQEDYDPSFDYTVKRVPKPPYTYKERPPRKPRIYVKKGRANCGGNNKKSVIFIKDSIETLYESVLAGCRSTGIRANKVYMVLKGQRKSHKGYTFKRLEN